jgi:hypothetical protein
MNPNAPEQNELRDRLDLIESMIAEGRRTTESWGWVFVLWGVAYYVAIAWAAWGHSALAWPVTMILAGVLTGILISITERRRPETTVGRAMAAIWIGMGISTFLVMIALGMTARLDAHNSVAIVAAMLGAANAASSIILRWKVQFACAVAWWAAGGIAAFASETVTGISFLVAIFLCQIVFGIYGMLAESRKRSSRLPSQGASHA